MCGLSGFFSRRPLQEDASNLLTAMGKTLSHRGPDDKGIWFDPKNNIGFSHARLSILDCSEAGHQPMQSPSGRYIITFNGEIYNHQELRKDLPFTDWKSRSDTESLLAGFDAWGIAATIKRAIGMFAFAVWDKKTLTLTLGRDRAGEKPLYYGWQHHTFLFGSELKALKIHPEFQAELDHNALALFLRHNYIPAPHSIYKGIQKLLPGHLLQVSLQQPEPVIIPYWTYKNTIFDGIHNPYQGNTTEATDELEGLLKQAVLQQMEADVPIGAFLSGGIDSSTITALMQTQSPRPIQTFSIGFTDDAFNEAPYAKQIAHHLGTFHTEMILTGEEAFHMIPKLPIHYDEPFADSSQIPTFLVAQLARKSVTVSLSGDAGDELFAGYNRYQLTQKLWGKIAKLPHPLRKGLAKVLQSIPINSWDRLFSRLPMLTTQHANIGMKLHKGAGVLTSKTVDEVYHRLISHHRDPATLLLKGTEPDTFMQNCQLDFEPLDSIHRMMATDLVSYLADDILVKVDRAAMASSLETRVPLLDHRIIEFAFRIPLSMKLREGKTKWLLRQVLYRHVPEHLIERPKMGFGIPLGNWLRGPLRDWAESLINQHRIQQEGIFKTDAIQNIWKQVLSDQGNQPYLAWNILMFQAWKESIHV